MNGCYYNENTCLHCGNGKPAYCEKCYQELIGTNAKLQENSTSALMYIDNECIRKSKIKEKINELNKMNLDCETFGSMRNYAVLILQELLESED